MKKHRITKIREASGTDEKEVSPEQLKQAQNWIADKLLEIVLKTPKDAPPVKESFSELLAELDSPKRAPVIVQTHDGKRLEVRDGITKIIEDVNENPILDQRKLTKTDSGGSEDSSIITGLTIEQEEILRKFQNGE